MIEIGTRVYAVLDADEHKVRTLGYGTYEGEFLSPYMSKPTVEAMKNDPVFEAIQDQFNSDEEIQEFIDGPMARLYQNPRIRLDSGGVVWGMECWWATLDEEDPEDFGERKIVVVTPVRNDDGTIYGWEEHP